MPEYPTFDPDRPFNDPTTSCCGRDAADCDCHPQADVLASMDGDHPWIPGVLFIQHPGLAEHLTALLEANPLNED